MTPASRHGGVIVVGSLNLDLVATADRLPRPGETVTGSSSAEHPGGKGLNQAIAAARAGAPTQMIGAVGADQAGRQLLDAAATGGVDTSSVRTVEHAPTGRALISVDQRGENSIIVVPGANGAVTAEHITPPVARPTGARVMLCQLEIPLAAVKASLDAARSADMLTVLDPAPATDLRASLLELVDVIAPNEHELQLLGGVDRLLDAGVGAVLVTLGADGAVLHRPGQPPVGQESFSVDVVDTTGAGDAFRGAFAARVAAGATHDEALPHAAAAGALATTVAGAVPSLPTRPAIEAMLDR